MQIDCGDGPDLQIPVSPRFCNRGPKESVLQEWADFLGISPYITYFIHGFPVSSHQLPVRNHYVVKPDHLVGSLNYLGILGVEFTLRLGSEILCEFNV